MDVDVSDQHEDSYNEIELRNTLDRPVFKLSVRLIDTYKCINKVYYESKAERLRQKAKDPSRMGIHNDGYDDENYDYILQGDEILNERYMLKHRMGKGSFGQVVCAYDQDRKIEVAVKIIKSRKPFLVQAKTEIDILNKINDKDPNEESNIVRLLDHFMFRHHQCLVFEILSFNLYELLKNTKFKGVSLNLIRKFSRQLLKSLDFLTRQDVDIVHCDLKPENILLKHPRRSAIKLIDFGSSCYLNKRTYSYIQSRFYRSPEVLLGLPYTQKIDMWSLGCVVVEMHTGEPLFAGANQNDQLCRIVDVLGMPPIEMIRASPEKTRCLFFERITHGADLSTLSAACDVTCMVHEEDGSAAYILKRPNRDMPKPRSLEQVVGVYTGGPGGRHLAEPDHSPHKYLEFLDFIKSILVWTPNQRASAAQILFHPYVMGDPPTSSPQQLSQSRLYQSQIQQQQQQQLQHQMQSFQHPPYPMPHPTELQQYQMQMQQSQYQQMQQQYQNFSSQNNNTMSNPLYFEQYYSLIHQQQEMIRQSNPMRGPDMYSIYGHPHPFAALPSDVSRGRRHDTSAAKMRSKSAPNTSNANGNPANPSSSLPPSGGGVNSIVASSDPPSSSSRIV